MAREGSRETSGEAAERLGEEKVGVTTGIVTVWVRWPTSACCNIVKYVLTGGWCMVQSGKRD